MIKKMDFASYLNYYIKLKLEDDANIYEGFLVRSLYTPNNFTLLRYPKPNITFKFRHIEYIVVVSNNLTIPKMMLINSKASI